MATDKFSFVTDVTDMPAREMFAITPHATNEISPIPKAIRCDVAGTVALRAVGSTSDVSITMAAGEVLSVRALYVRATGTTATLHAFA